MNVDKEILDDVIKYLVEIDFIDQDLYHNEQIIWIPRFVEKFREEYRKRGRCLPYKQGNKIIVSATEINSKEKKRKVSKEKKESTKKKGTGYKKQKSAGQIALEQQSQRESSAR